MGKKNKNKTKKISARKEKYSKFKKEKSGILDVSMPELSEDQIKQRREDEKRLESYWRFSKNRPAHENIKTRRRLKN
jgi:hypothetical protein